MESFNLNIIPGKDRPVCHASQYDIGRTIHVNLFEGFNVFTLDGTEVISISVRKPDGNVVTESVTNTSDSYVEFVTTEQMTACHGSNLCELKLEKGADVIGTMNFILEVEQDPLEGGVQSASEIDNLQTQVAGMVATEVANQYDSADVIFDNNPTAGHGVGYTVTSEGIKTAIEQAQQDVEDLIALAYDDTATYNQGDIVIYNGTLYACNDNSVTGAWDATKWDATTLQTKTDNTLATTDKTVVGAINELKSVEDSLTATSITVTRTTGASSSIPMPSATRYGKIVLVYLLLNMPSGNYDNNTPLYTFNPKPKSSTRFILRLGATNDIVDGYISSSTGELHINGNVDWSAGYWMGEAVYICE